MAGHLICCYGVSMGMSKSQVPEQFCQCHANWGHVDRVRQSREVGAEDWETKSNLIHLTNVSCEEGLERPRYRGTQANPKLLFRD